MPHIVRHYPAGMRNSLLEVLVDPITRGPLTLRADGQSDGEIERGSLVGSATYPIRNGIPVLLLDEALPLGAE